MRQIANFVETLNQVVTILISTYFLGMIWYRLSDYLIADADFLHEPDERYWVVKFDFRRPKCE